MDGSPVWHVYQSVPLELEEGEGEHSEAAPHKVPRSMPARGQTMTKPMSVQQVLLQQQKRQQQDTQLSTAALDEVRLVRSDCKKLGFVHKVEMTGRARQVD